jgi:FkbM family methyltransferase
MIKTNYTEVLDTDFGKIIIFNTDTNQGTYYKTNKKHIDQNHINKLINVIKDLDSPVIVDAGANLGWFSLELKHANPSSTIFAFEPQKSLFYAFCGSTALNCYTNMHIFNMALGNKNDTIDIPIFDYSIISNFGGVEIDPDRNHKEYIGQSATIFESIPLRTIDSFNFSKLDLLKIDVEGMETKVLEGAVETIKRCKPIMFVEFLKSDVGALKTQIEKLGYEIREILTENFLCFPVDR